MSLQPRHTPGQDAERLERLERLEEAAHGRPQATLRMLSDVVDERRVKVRDCRDCKNFERDDSGLNFGWCNAHDQYVKMFHPPGQWFSQCIFKGLRRFKPQELEKARAVELARPGSLIPDEGLEPSIEGVV